MRARNPNGSNSVFLSVFWKSFNCAFCLAKFTWPIHFWFLVFVAAIKKIPNIAKRRTTESVLVPNISLSRIIDVKIIATATISNNTPSINLKLFKMFHPSVERLIFSYYKGLGLKFSPTHPVFPIALSPFEFLNELPKR